MQVDFTIDRRPYPAVEHVMRAVDGLGRFVSVREIVGRCRCYRLRFDTRSEFVGAAVGITRIWKDVGIAVLADQLGG